MTTGFKFNITTENYSASFFLRARIAAPAPAAAIDANVIVAAPVFGDFEESSFLPGATSSLTIAFTV